jgi:hypothetical protein
MGDDDALDVSIVSELCDDAISAAKNLSFSSSLRFMHEFDAENDTMPLRRNSWKQCWERSKWVDPMWKAINRDAVKIQALWRGCLGRKSAAMRRKEHIANWTEAIKQECEDRNNAARILQRLFRLACSLIVIEKNDAAVVVTNFFRMAHEMIKYDEMWEKVVLLQSATRMALTRHKMSEELETMREKHQIKIWAAIRIQSFARMVLAIIYADRLVEETDAAVVLQAVSRRKIATAQFKTLLEEHDCAGILQSTFRMTMARTKYRRGIEQSDAAVTLQSAIRMAVAKKQFDLITKPNPELDETEADDAAVDIQRIWRGFTQKKRYTQYMVFLHEHDSATEIQARFKRFRMLKASKRVIDNVKATGRNGDEMIEAAVKIQSFMRMVPAMNHFEEQQESTTKLQAAVRMSLSKLRYERELETLDAAVTVQTLFRMGVARARLKLCLKLGNLEEEDAKMEREDAATEIQSTFRGYNQRKRYLMIQQRKGDIALLMDGKQPLLVTPSPTSSPTSSSALVSSLPATATEALADDAPVAEAIKIQQHVRRRNIQEDFRRKRRGAVTLQSMFRQRWALASVRVLKAKREAEMAAVVLAEMEAQKHPGYGEARRRAAQAKVDGSMTLDLSDLDLPRIPCGELNGCMALQDLDLRSNSIEHVGGLEGLASLKRLNLSMNRLTALPAEVVGGLVSLVELDIRDNRGITELCLELGQLKQLKKLHLGDMAKNMTFPPAEVCTQGTEAIIAFFADEYALVPLRKLFDKLDKDSSGTVDKKEWGRSLSQNKELMAKYFGGETMAEIGKQFNCIDADQSGDLTWEEVKDAVIHEDQQPIEEPVHIQEKQSGETVPQEQPSIVDIAEAEEKVDKFVASINNRGHQQMHLSASLIVQIQNPQMREEDLAQGRQAQDQEQPLLNTTDDDMPEAQRLAAGAIQAVYRGNRGREQMAQTQEVRLYVRALAVTSIQCMVRKFWALARVRNMLLAQKAAEEAQMEQCVMEFVLEAAAIRLQCFFRMGIVLLRTRTALVKEELRLEAEEQARQAEEQAKKDAAAKEKAKIKQAFEEGKRHARREIEEEKARKEAEEKAQKEAAQKAKRDAEEKARKEAKERARKRAEEKAKKEAEEQAREKADDKARKEAEEKAKKEAEKQAKKDAAEKGIRDAEERALREEEERARKEAEEAEASRQAAFEQGMQMGMEASRDATAKLVAEKTEIITRFKKLQARMRLKREAKLQIEVMRAKKEMLKANGIEHSDGDSGEGSEQQDPQTSPQASLVQQLRQEIQTVRSQNATAIQSAFRGYHQRKCEHRQPPVNFSSTVPSVDVSAPLGPFASTAPPSLVAAGLPSGAHPTPMPALGRRRSSVGGSSYPLHMHSATEQADPVKPLPKRRERSPPKSPQNNRHAGHAPMATPASSSSSSSSSSNQEVTAVLISPLDLPREEQQERERRAAARNARRKQETSGGKFQLPMQQAFSRAMKNRAASADGLRMSASAPVVVVRRNQQQQEGRQVGELLQTAELK